MTQEGISECAADLIYHGERWIFFMPAAIKLRADYRVGDLRRLAESSRDTRQTRRVFVALTDVGSSRRRRAVGGVTLQIVRDGVLRFNAKDPSDLVDR
jgi:hypothetical protein